MEKLIDLYKKWAGEEPADVIKLAGQGSNRQYFRIIGHDGDTVIGVIGTSRDEDHAFVYLAQHFQLRQLPVPQILAVSDDELCYLQTDLGIAVYNQADSLLGRNASLITIEELVF